MNFSAEEMVKIFYLCTIIFSVLLMIAMTIHVAKYSGFTKTQKFWYILTFVSIAFCSLAEYAVHCGFYNEDFAIPLTLLTVVQFSLAPLLGVFFTGALGLHKEAQFASFLFAGNFIVQLICAPFGWVFSFDSTGYSRGPAFHIYTAFYAMSLIYLIVCMVIVGRKFRNRDVTTIGMILVVMAVGIVPMMLAKINVTYIAIAISAVLCYIYYNDLVQQDTQKEYQINQKKLSNIQVQIITGLANLIENRDLETGEHVARTSEYCRIIAQSALKDGFYTDEIDEHFVSLIFQLAPMHDIGKIVVSDTILKKPGKLTPEEFEEMKKHAAMGGDIARQVLNGITDEEYISFASDIATYHHEKWNGTGYPKGLKRTEIPLSARIMAIADVFDALVSERCYKKAIPVKEALRTIKDDAGTHFDPILVEVFLNHKDEIIEVMEKTKKEK